MITFTEKYTIFNPTLHNEKYPKLRVNSLLGDITYEFSQDALNNYGLHGLSFCFFIKWNDNFESGVLDKHIWIKKGINVHEDGCVDLNKHDFLEKFLSCEPLSSIKNNYQLMNHYNLELSYTIIKSIPLTVQPPNTKNVIADLSYNGSHFEYNIINYGQLKKLLLSYSGRSIRMGKPLNYYETELEKILSLDHSENAAPFPGDCDLLLYDNDMKCKAIIEFKKRTSAGSDKSISEQTIDNFIHRDMLKYRRLNILREHFENIDMSTIPLLVVYYSTAKDSEIDKIKIESVSHNLQSESTNYFELTSSNVNQNHSMILEHIMQFI